MCGISVVVERSGGPVDPAVVVEMNRRVIHRGPDDEGVFLGEGFALGHRRLSILDLSAAGHQPMAFRDRLVVTYNGEIYNYIELRAELIGAGYTFETSTDTEVLLAAYDHWGEDCVRRFNGMWAFVLWDKRRDLLFCSRDRFGVKPLHYVELHRYFALASEVKQLLAVPGFEAKLDEIAAYRFLAHGQLSIDERGFLQGVKELRGGHNLVYELAGHRHRIERWYDLASAARPISPTFSEAAAHFKQLFFDAVRVRLRSDVAVGSCLSGGVDSSSIASAARALTGSTQALRTVSAAWDDERCDETRYADQVTRATGFSAVVTRPRIDELLSKGTLDRIIYHQDQPILGASHFAEYGVFEAARAQRLVVMLDGQGADEYLAGYADFFAAFVRGQIGRGRILPAWREARLRARLRGLPAQVALRSLLGSLLSGPLHEIGTRIRPGGSARASRLAPWFGPRLSQLAREPSASGPDHAAARSIRELSITQLLATSVPYQLHSEDRNSMLHSIESRLPFLDYRLVEFGLSLPDEFKIRDGATKAVIREALRGVLPEAIRSRHDKVGFAAPEQPWIRRNAASIRCELASATAAFPGMFNAALLARFDAMIAGSLAYSPLFFRVLSFRRFAQLFQLSV
jgi:asparagine synthase (glutamine-hydrolysing)